MQKLTYEDALHYQRLSDKHQGNLDLIAKDLGVRQSAARTRRMYSEKVLGIEFPRFKGGSSGGYTQEINTPEYENISANKETLKILIGSDKHNLPGQTPQAFKAFLSLAEATKPDYIVVAGDWFDFPAISTHHRIGWAHKPSVVEELENGVECLKRIKQASPKSKRVFLLGNHDMRFDGKIGNVMPELEGIKGVHLADYLPDWNIGLSAVFNGSFMVKHRWNNGVHSSYNDTLKGGISTASGHDHKLNIRPYTDYRGTRYGIKTGTLSDLWDESFMYLENNCTDWQPGCVMVEMEGSLLIPTACPIVIDRGHRRRGKLRYNGVWYG